MNTWSATSAIGCSAKRPPPSEAGRAAATRRTTAVACLAVGLAAAPALGAQEVDAGQLEVRVEGRRVGLERFRVWRTGSTVNAVATIERDRSEEWQVGVQMNADLLPVKYQLREGRLQRVGGERLADRVRFHMVTDEGERWKEFPAAGVQAVVEDGVSHHYLVLLMVLRAAPGNRAAVVVPSRGEAATARLVGEAADRVSIGDRSVSATRYEIQVGGATHTLWVDAEGRLLRVLEAASGRESLRLPARD